MCIRDSTNAVKYNRQGGRVEVNLTNENGAPCLRVFNTGEPLSLIHIL